MMNYEMCLEAIVTGILCICSVTDWVYQKLWLPVLILPIPVMVFCLYSAGNDMKGNICCSLAIGIIVLGISALTHGQIERGDGLLLAVILLGIGGWQGCVFLFLSFFYAFLFAGMLVVFRKKRKNYRIPLAPFSLAGYMTILLFTRMG